MSAISCGSVSTGSPCIACTTGTEDNISIARSGKQLICTCLRVQAVSTAICNQLQSPHAIKSYCVAAMIVHVCYVAACSQVPLRHACCLHVDIYDSLLTLRRKKGMPCALRRGSSSRSPLSMKQNWRAPAFKNAGTCRYGTQVDLALARAVQRMRPLPAMHAYLHYVKARLEASASNAIPLGDCRSDFDMCKQNMAQPLTRLKATATGAEFLAACSRA